MSLRALVSLWRVFLKKKGTSLAALAFALTFVFSGQVVKTQDRQGMPEAALTATPSVIAIAAGSYHNVVLKDDGTVWTWGRNRYGQLGRPEVESPHSTIPVQVRGL